MTDTNDLLKQGIAALKAGQKAEARHLLEQVVQQDKHNETAWLWLSGAVDTDEERRVCLENVLSINPGNEPARRGLARLKADRPLRSLDSVKAPTPRADDESLARADMLPRPEPAAAKQAAMPSQPVFQKPEVKRAKRKSQLTSTQWLILSGAGAIVLLVFCCLIGLLWPSPPQSVTSDSSLTVPTATPTPLPPLPRTVTTGEWTFTITSVDLLNVIETPSKRYRPEKGIYLVILGTVANASDENETFRFSDWKLQDAGGIRYEVDDDATGAAQSIYDLDYPGWILGLRVEYDHSRETYVLFDVLSDAKELRLYFKGGTAPLVLGDIAYLTQLAETAGKATVVATQAATATTVAPTPTRVFPVATPTRPPTPTRVFPTPTQIPTQKPAGPPLEVQLYLSEVATKTDAIAEALMDLGELSQYPRYYDENWIIAVSVDMVVIQLAHEELAAMDVPPEMAEIHSALLDATGDFHAAMDYLSSGIDNYNTADIETATALMLRGNDKLEKPLRMIEEYGAQFE